MANSQVTARTSQASGDDSTLLIVRFTAPAASQEA